MTDAEPKALVERIAEKYCELRRVSAHPMISVTLADHIRAIESLGGRIVFPDMVTEEMLRAAGLKAAELGPDVHPINLCSACVKAAIAAAPKLGGGE